MERLNPSSDCLNDARSELKVDRQLHSIYLTDLKTWTVRDTQQV